MQPLEHAQARGRPRAALPLLPCFLRVALLLPWAGSAGSAGGSCNDASTSLGATTSTAAQVTAVREQASHAHAALRRHDIEGAIGDYGRALAALGGADAAAATACHAVVAALEKDLTVWHKYRSGGDRPSEETQRSAMAAYLSAADAALRAAVAPGPHAATMRATRRAALLRAAMYAGVVRDIKAMATASRGIIDGGGSAQGGRGGALSNEDLAAAHTQLGVALSTQGSLQGNTSLHRQARASFEAALALQPRDLATLSRLGCVEGGRLLQLWQPCVEHLRPVAAAMDRRDPSLRRQRHLLEQAITALDTCLTRLGRRKDAHSVRRRAADAGVYRSAEQQNSAAVVQYAGMRSQRWWEPSEISPEMASAVQRMQNKAAALAQEARGLQQDYPECWRQNTEGLADGSWSECALITLGVPNASLCGSAPVTCGLLGALRDEGRPELSAVHLARLSMLRGPTHLWPHCGPTNARIRLHVPLFVPEGDYRLVLGEREHRWSAGKAVVFDDSFRHEVYAIPSAKAIADGNDTRVVLIVDVWHPDVPMDQRPALLGWLWEREGAAASFQL